MPSAPLTLEYAQMDELNARDTHRIAETHGAWRFALIDGCQLSVIGALSDIATSPTSLDRSLDHRGHIECITLNRWDTSRRSFSRKSCSTFRGFRLFSGNITCRSRIHEALQIFATTHPSSRWTETLNSERFHKRDPQKRE